AGGINDACEIVGLNGAGGGFESVVQRGGFLQDAVHVPGMRGFDRIHDDDFLDWSLRLHGEDFVQLSFRGDKDDAASRVTQNVGALLSDERGVKRNDDCAQGEASEVGK